MDLDLKSLEIFRAVVEEGSISGAAKKLNRVQSNISTRIMQLESTVQKQLFLRTGRALKLTNDGTLLLKYAEQLLALKEAATEALSDPAPRGTLRIGAMESTAATRLPSVLAKYNQEHSNVRIDLITDTAAGLVGRLHRAEVDCIFVAESAADPRFDSKSVFTEDLILIAPPDFKAVTNFKQLDRQTLIAFEEGCAYRGYLENWLKQQQIRPGNILSMSSYLAIFSCVSAGTGFAVSPRAVLDLFGDAFPLQYFEIGGKFQNIQTLLLWNKGAQSVNLTALQELFDF